MARHRMAQAVPALVVGVLSLTPVSAQKGGGEAFERARGLVTEGNQLAASGDVEAAETLYRQALRLLGSSEEERLLAAKIRFNLGAMAQLEGEVEGARELYEQALAVLEAANPVSTGDWHGAQRYRGDLVAVVPGTMIDSGGRQCAS